MQRWFTRPKTVTHSGSNRVWRSITTLCPKLANLLGTKMKLASLVPAGLDTCTSSDAYSDGEDSAKLPTKNRTKTKWYSQKATVPASSDEEERLTKDKEKKSKRKVKIEKTDRPVLPAAADDKKKVVSSKVNDNLRAKREQQDGRDHCRSKKDGTARPTKMRPTKTRDAADPRTLLVFDLGEYPAPPTAELSLRLEAIKKNVKRAHKNKRKSQKQTSVKRRGRDDDIGTRKTLKTDALFCLKFTWLSSSEMLKIR